MVNSVRLAEDERPRTTCLMVDSHHRVIASTDGKMLFQPYPLKTEGKKMSTYIDSEGNLVGFALTPGYETYPGLGWYGVLIQKPVVESN